MKLRKSLLSVLLALILLVSMLPVASAEAKTVTITVDAGITDISLRTDPDASDGVTLTPPAAGSNDYILTIADDVNESVTIYLTLTYAYGYFHNSATSPNITSLDYNGETKEISFELSTISAPAPLIEVSTYFQYYIEYIVTNAWVDGVLTKVGPGETYHLGGMPTSQIQWYTPDYTGAIHGSPSLLDSTNNNSGKTFLGWVDADGTTYLPDTPLFHMAQNYTLTAAYDGPSSVTYVDSNGTAPIDTATYSSGDTVTLQQPIDAISAFAGWVCSADDQIYTAGATYTMPVEAVTFTAAYPVKDTTYAYDLSDVEITTASKDLIESSSFGSNLMTGQTIYLTTYVPVPTKDWLSYYGWNLDWLANIIRNGGYGIEGAKNDAPHKITPVYQTTLEYDDGVEAVTMADAIEGMPTPASEPDVILDGNTTDRLTIPATAPTRNGYTFGGWRYNVDNVVYQTGAAGPAKPTLAQLLALDAQPTLTAVWNLPGTGNTPGTGGTTYYPDYDTASTGTTTTDPGDITSPKTGDPAPMAALVAALALIALLVARKRVRA